MTQLISDILERAAARIEPKGAWVQYADALDASGHPVDPKAPSACSWCMAGAVRAECASALDYPWVRKAVAAVLPKRLCAVTAFNDDPARKQRDVVKALRRAAAKARISEGKAL